MKTLVAKIRDADKEQIRVQINIRMESGGRLKIMVLVSVGKANFNLEAMRAIIALLNEIHEAIGPFEVVFNVADTLQRFNLAALSDSTPEDQLGASREKGTQWLAKDGDGGQALAGLRVPYSVIRWDHWREHSGYETARDEILAFAAANPEEFNRCMEESINEYLERQKKELGAARSESIAAQYREYCRQYLEEEIITMLLWRETNCDFALYPGKETPIMRLVAERLIYPKQAGPRLQWLDIRLKRKEKPVLSSRLLANRHVDRLLAASARYRDWTDDFVDMLNALGITLTPQMTVEFIPLCIQLIAATTQSLPEPEQRNRLRIVALVPIAAATFGSALPLPEARLTSRFWSMRPPTIDVSLPGGSVDAELNGSPHDASGTEECNADGVRPSSPLTPQS